MGPWLITATEHLESIKEVLCITLLAQENIQFQSLKPRFYRMYHFKAKGSLSQAILNWELFYSIINM